jgi:hypothetical protein
MKRGLRQNIDAMVKCQGELFGDDSLIHQNQHAGWALPVENAFGSSIPFESPSGISPARIKIGQRRPRLSKSSHEQILMTGRLGHGRINPGTAVVPFRNFGRSPGRAMKATPYNLTNMPVTLDGQNLTTTPQPLGCSDPLPAALAGRYFLVPACLAAAAHTRGDIVWSASIPHCSHCAPVPSKRSWF